MFSAGNNAIQTTEMIGKTTRTAVTIAKIDHGETASLRQKGGAFMVTCEFIPASYRNLLTLSRKVLIKHMKPE